MSLQSDSGFGLAIPSFGNQINFYIELFLFVKFVSDIFVGGWYRSLLSRGGTKNTYVLSAMICDFCMYTIFTQGFYIANVIFGID